MDRNQDQQGRSAIGGSSQGSSQSPQPQYGVSRAHLQQNFNSSSWDSFVVIAKEGGQTKIFTSEQDEQKTTQLLKQSFPQLAGLETTS